MIKYAESQDRHDCCGCFACEKICGVKAITLVEDERGFFYPVVDRSLCVNCGRCDSVCPMEKDYVKETADPDIYAVVYKNDEIVRRSSSGGFFSVLGKWILKHGGTVYGAAFDENYMVHHQRGETPGDIRHFRGSKYVESDIRNVYGEAAQDLKDGRYVLLSGTPCQISALNTWMEMKKVPTEKLYTCDVICHGIPSRKVWSDYLEIIQGKYAGEDHPIKGVNMRSKRISWEKQAFRIQTEGKNIDNLISDFSFNQIFLSLNLHRQSCFVCKYTSFKRPGDFSMGDFWNYESAGLKFSPTNGLSEVFVNTEKGRQLFRALSDEIYFQKISKEAAWQPHLEYAAKEPASHEAFWKDYLSGKDKEMVLRQYMKGGVVTRLIHAVTPLLRKSGLYTRAGKLYRTVFKQKRAE